MKYKFQVVVMLTYEDKEIEVEIDLTDKEISHIKELISTSEEIKQDLLGEDELNIEKDLLTILEMNDPKLFDKFWEVIMRAVFVELVINGIENYGCDFRHEEDNFADYRKANFDELFAMYGDSIEIEHSSSCICRIPEIWLSDKKIKRQNENPLWLS